MHLAMHRIATLGALALLTACSGVGSRIGPPSIGGAMGDSASLAQPAKKYAGTVFVSDLDNNAVWICPANRNDIRAGYLPSSNQLQGVSDPSQIAVDAQGTVYVANAQTDASGAGAIAIYPRGATSPARTLTSGLNTTEGVAVDSAGTVYASNKYQASIVIFAKGKSEPQSRITKNLVGPDGLAVDNAGNLYIADSSANDILKLSPKSKVPQSLHLKKLLRPYGVALDSKGNLYVSNMLGAASTIGVYAPGSTAPKQQFVVPGPSFNSQSTIGEPAMLSVAQPGDVLIASAPLALALIGGVEWFGFQPAVVGFAAGQSHPLWSQYINTGYDAVFQPRK